MVNPAISRPKGGKGGGVHGKTKWGEGVVVRRMVGAGLPMIWVCNVSQTRGMTCLNIVIKLSANILTLPEGPSRGQKFPDSDFAIFLNRHPRSLRGMGGHNVGLVTASI